MYFLSTEEKRLILRRLAPQARQRGVAEELRGWNWHHPPLSPIFDTRLGVFEVAGQYCPTGRDLYMRRVMGVKAPPSPAMAEGGYLHALLCRIILASKRALYAAEGNPLDALEALRGSRVEGRESSGQQRGRSEGSGSRAQGPGGDEGSTLRPEAVAPRSTLDSRLSPLDPEPSTLNPGVDPEPSTLNPGVDPEPWREKGALLWTYEHRQIMARAQEVLARQPHIGVDSLVALALPVVVEQKLDGTFLGLSAHLSVDAFVWSEPMVLDIKFGRKERFHRLSTTGYALVMESIHEYPVDLGCLVYASFARGRLLIEREFHLIDDELRQWFIESRDERARMVEEEIDPGLAQECQRSCPYYRACRPE